MKLDREFQTGFNFIGGVAIFCLMFINKHLENESEKLKSQMETHLEMIEAQQQDIAELREDLELLRPRVR